MLVVDSNNKPIILDNIHQPNAINHIWVLDLEMQDFTLAPLLVFEEIICPTLEILINGFKFNLPSYWSILIVDDETMQLDTKELYDLGGKEFKALVYGPKMNAPEAATIQVTDYFPSMRNVGPAINKHQMLCHPISPDAWVNISPTDAYNKYLKNAVAGDLI